MTARPTSQPRGQEPLMTWARRSPGEIVTIAATVVAAAVCIVAVVLMFIAMLILASEPAYAYAPECYTPLPGQPPQLPPRDRHRRRARRHDRSRRVHRDRPRRVPHPRPPRPGHLGQDPPMSALVQAAFSEWRECREEYELALYAQYVRAEAETNGALLNADARSRGVDALSLFMGPERRAHAHASEELLEHWQRTPRVTFADFERQWMRDREEERWASP